MAQTKPKRKTRAKSSTSAKSSGAKSKSSRGGSRKASRNGGAAKAAARNGSANGVAKGANAIRSVGKGAASKAKMPLLVAGGAVLGGAATAVSSKKSGKVLGLKMPKPKRVKIRSKDLTKAAKEVSSFGEQVGELTEELRRVRKGMSKA
jgi:hypothetical protein